MDRLNAVEVKMLEALQITQAYLTQTKVRKYEYTDIMGKIRDAIKAGECKQGGCPWGKHIASCTCTNEKQGYNRNEFRWGPPRFRDK